MQIIITHGTRHRTRVLQFSRLQLAALLVTLPLLVVAVIGLAYHLVFVEAVRAGWPVVGELAMQGARDEMARRDRFMRENLDAIAQKVGQIQARMVGLEVMGARVSDLAGVKPEERAMAVPVQAAGVSARGGPYVPLDKPTLEQLYGVLGDLEVHADQQADLLLLSESRLFENRLSALMVPTSRPLDGPAGSGFGFRPDPFTGRIALHTGLDFPADTGTPVMAAAGGVVRSIERHPQYGLLLEIDHGNGLSTRYAHTSRVLVKEGDLVKRGQRVALAGNSGRSTGTHLHFEVLVAGVPQNPSKFLALEGAAPVVQAALARKR